MIELSGPFFQRDPGLTLRGNIERMVQAIADEGASSARQSLQAGEGSRATITALGDRVSDHVIGRTHARPSRGGRQWRASAVVQVYNEGLDAASSRSLMAAASSVERRVRTFRSLAGSLRRSRAVLTANLTAGIE